MSKKSQHKAKPQVDCLETRNLLTGGAGGTFAISSSTITSLGGQVTMPITIDPQHFTLPKSGKLYLGLDVAPANSSNAKPAIVQVQSSNGKPVPGVQHKVFDPRVKATSGSALATAVIVPLQFKHTPGSNNFTAQTFKVVISTTTSTNGNILLGSYLPGDANGDGTVNQADISLIKSLNNTLATNSKYNFDADVNRDGNINAADLKIARQNLGAKLTIQPSVSAVLDPASDTGAQDRITSLSSVRFSGTATPGATISYSEISNKVTPVQTTVDTNGNYSLMVPLGYGSNTFHVATMDAYGQSVSGNIQPVTLNNNPPPQLSTPTTSQTTTTANNQTTATGISPTTKTT